MPDPGESAHVTRARLGHGSAGARAAWRERRSIYEISQYAHGPHAACVRSRSRASARGQHLDRT